LRPGEISPGTTVRLDRCDPNDTSGFSGTERDAEAELARLRVRLLADQELLYAGHEHKVLIVLQGVDTAGKDGTIRRVFDGVNPQSVRVARFGPPTPPELDHDFLWRVHARVPAKGEMVIFNRSHYEDVLIARVRKLVPKRILKSRYREINEFERTLAKEGTIILKFFLHIDFREQGRRLRTRLEDPSKHWKFSASDLIDRRLWDKFQRAYEEALERTSTEWAPWVVVPSNHKWYRDLVVLRSVVRNLDRLGMKYPPLSTEAKAFLRRQPWGKSIAPRPAR
jgi:PPK2 family polyphosphate:nucleotide phosphotransferase